MAKVTGPLFSLDARGQIGQAVVYSYWRGINYARVRVIPHNPKSVLQGKIRDLILDASVAWKNEATVGATEIDAAYKLAYKTAAEGQRYSGFNLFMKECVSKNEGSAYDGTLVIPTEPGDDQPA